VSGTRDANLVIAGATTAPSYWSNAMDPRSDEQTELLRNIWNEMKALGTNLGGRIDGAKHEVAGLRADVGELRKDVDVLTREMVEVKHAIVEMKAEIVEIKSDIREIRLDVHDMKLELRAVRVATQSTFELQSREQSDLRDRVVRIEDHLGLRPPKRKH
jgi:uncharacterized coiled-coil DUF342 family protein